MTGASLLALALVLAAAPSATAAARPLLDGFEKLPFPKERQAQARDVEKVVRAVGSRDANALHAALAQGAALKVDAGAETPLTLAGLARALDGCTGVVDFAIPVDRNLLGLVWRCGGSERAAYFRFVGDRLAAVRIFNNYVAYAPPPPPPPPPRNSATWAEMQSRLALTSVRRHFGVLARRDPAELETFYQETSATPVSGLGRPALLRDFYKEQVAPEDGREVKVTGCRTAPDFPKTERVDCTLIIDMPAANGIAARSTYRLGYILKGRNVERVVVAQAPPTQVTN